MVSHIIYFDSAKIQPLVMVIPTDEMNYVPETCIANISELCIITGHTDDRYFIILYMVKFFS